MTASNITALVRATLARTIQARSAAAAELAAVQGAETRAGALVAEAERAAQAFDGIDKEANAHRARAVRAGRSIDLPPELAQRVRARDLAMGQATDARGALLHLRGELADAEAALAERDQAVAAAADAVMADDADAKTRRLAALEAEAAALRQHLHGYVGLAAEHPAALHKPTAATSALVQSRPANAGLEFSRERASAWADYHRRLTADPAAEPPAIPAPQPNTPGQTAAEREAAQLANIAQAMAQAPRSPWNPTGRPMNPAEALLAHAGVRRPG